MYLEFQVNNLDSADSQLTHATSTGYSNYPSALFFANINSRGYPHLESNMSSPCLIWPAFLRDDGSLYIPRNDLASGSTNVQQSSSSLAQNVLASDAENQQSDQFVTPMDVCPGEPSASSDVQMASTSNSLPLPAIARPSGSAVDRMPVNSFTTSGLDVQMFLRNSEGGNHHHDLFSDSRSWELPFLHGWLMAQSQTGLHPAFLNNTVLKILPLGGVIVINFTRESQRMNCSTSRCFFIDTDSRWQY
jgi:activating molecule in BECN1-regulated autophagy protein 1